MKHLGKTFVCLVLIISVCSSTANAFEIMPLADSEFDVASALLSTRKDVSFSCLTYEIKGTIKITSCWLQKKSGDNWVWVCPLTAPSTVATNTDTYAALMDYSSMPTATPSPDTPIPELSETPPSSTHNAKSSTALSESIRQCYFFSRAQASVEEE